MIKIFLTDYEADNMRENPLYLAKLDCGHMERFVYPPIVGWWEWCSTCKDYSNVIDRF
jgi:hypothetical protein